MTRHLKKTFPISSETFAFTLFLTILLKGVDSATLLTSVSPPKVTAGLTDLDLICSVSGLTASENVSSFTWKFSNQNILTYSPATGTPMPTPPWTAPTFADVSVTARLPKDKLTKTFKGQYECAAILNTGSLPSKSVTVEVQYKPEITIAGSSSVKEGDSLSLTCNSAAVPATSSTSWKKGSTPVSSKNQLTIPSITADKSGTYTCTANNAVGSTEKSVSVDVYYLGVPEVASKTVQENSTLSVRCTVRSNPTATISLTGPGKNQSSSGNSFDYTIPSRCASTGQYSCSARNTKYSIPTQRTFNITVLCSPRKDPMRKVTTEFVKNRTESVAMVGPIIAYPPATFRWRKQVLDTNETIEISNEPGHLEITNSLTTSTLTVTVASADDYAKYTLEAENDQGKTTLDYFLRSLTTPYKVTMIEEVNVTEDSLAVRWLSSFNGGSEQSFILQYKPASEGTDQGWIQKTKEISDRGRNEFVYDRISGVSPGREYAVRVFSRNAIGQSLYSDEISVTTEDILSFGTGFAVGLVIALVLVAIVIGAIFLYLKKIKPKREARGGRQNGYEDTNGQPSSSGLYDGLESTRERPTTYDDLKTDTIVYQNVERKVPPIAQSQEKVYVNLTTQKSDVSSVCADRDHSDKQVYANT